MGKRGVHALVRQSNIIQSRRGVRKKYEKKKGERRSEAISSECQRKERRERNFGKGVKVDGHHRKKKVRSKGELWPEKHHREN